MGTQPSLEGEVGLHGIKSYVTKYNTATSLSAHFLCLYYYAFIYHARIAHVRGTLCP